MGFDEHFTSNEPLRSCTKERVKDLKTKTPEEVEMRKDT
jgi:hypothetical protein